MPNNLKGIEKNSNSSTYNDKRQNDEETGTCIIFKFLVLKCLSIPLTLNINTVTAERYFVSSNSQELKFNLDG